MNGAFSPLIVVQAIIRNMVPLVAWPKRARPVHTLRLGRFACQSILMLASLIVFAHLASSAF